MTHHILEKCPNCGAEKSGEEKTCVYCGMSLARDKSEDELEKEIEFHSMFYMKI